MAGAAVNETPLADRRLIAAALQSEIDALYARRRQLIAERLARSEG